MASARWATVAGCCAGVVLIAGFVTRLAYGFEWDELQLLHGAWSIAQGLVPYRDFFEHHPPLMLALMAPVVRGETEISWPLLVLSRMIALGLVAAAALCFTRLLRLTTREGASWGLLALVATSPLAGKFFELRADWAALLCVLGMMLVVAPARAVHDTGLRRSLLAGVLGGIAACFSQKAIPLALGTIAWCLLVVTSLEGWEQRRRALARTIALIAGMLVAPTILVLLFWHDGALRAFLDSTVVMNLGWPREVRWQRSWYASSTAALGPVVLALAGIGRTVHDALDGDRPLGVEGLVACIAVGGLLAYMGTPVPWEQSYLLLVAPWVAYLAIARLARYADDSEALHRDRWLLGVAALLGIASLPGALAVRAALVWSIVAAAVVGGALRSRNSVSRLPRALLAVVLPGIVLFAHDRVADVLDGRGAAQSRFSHDVAALAGPDEPVLVLWDHVLPFRPAATFHWFAHEGVLRLLSPESSAETDLDVEYATAVERGGARVVVADENALNEYLPRLRRVLVRRCRLAVPGYAGSDAWACPPTEEARRHAAHQPPLSEGREAAHTHSPESSAATAAADAPNVVLVIIDTLRADHVSAYGYDRATTPHIDALARDGVLFENTVSQAPWTSASVASLLTGLYPSVHGLDSGAQWESVPSSSPLPFVIQRTLNPSVRTLAQVLHARGYQTAAFISNVYLNAAFGFARGFDVYDDDHADYSGDVLSRKRRGDETNRRVARWLAAGPKEPFFLLVHYNDPHWPYDPPSPYGAEWVAGYRGPLTPHHTGAVVETEGRPVRDLDRDSLRYLVGLYDGEIRFADANAGALFEHLRSAGLRRPLLTVLTADHGEEFLDHGSMSHGYTLYDEQIRVPLVMSLPGRLPVTRVRSQVELIDVMPTLLDLVGLGSTADTQGTSLVELMRGTTSHGPGNAFSEAPLRGTLRSVRTEAGWKLVEDVGRGRRQLFDLARDPRELLNLSAHESRTLAVLRRRIGRWVGTSEEQRAALGLDGTAHAAVVDEATRQRLEQLGYVPARVP